MILIFVQYGAMAASLFSMVWAIALLRQSADPVYLAHIGFFLMLLAWSTPFETAFSNILFKNAKDDPRSVQRLFSGAQNLRFVSKAAIVGLGFAITFFILSRAYEGAVYAALAAGMLFFFRIQEFVIKTRLIFKKFGQQAQIAINLATTTKWIGAAILLSAGYSSFVAFGVINVTVSLVVVALLSYTFLRRDWQGQPEDAAPTAGADWRHEAVSLAGMVAGVLAFQVDKLIAAFYYPAEAFGEYVVIYTMAMLGPYLLNPVFVLSLQKLALVDRSAGSDLEPTGQMVESLIRVAALGASLALSAGIPLALGWFSEPLTGTMLLNFVLLSGASYLSCIAHGYYIRFLATGELSHILAQNAIALVLAAGTGAVLLYIQSDLLGLAVLAAALGQLLFPFFGLIRRKGMHLSPLEMLVPVGLMAYLAVIATIGENILALLVLVAAAVALLIIALISEAARAHLSSIHYVRSLIELVI